jgi:hypothetical protein
MRERVRRAAVAAALVCAVSACDEQLSDVAGPTPNLTPTFSSIQRDIFNTADSSGRVACIDCHSDSGRVPAGGLVLLEGRSHQNLVGASSRFKPGATLVVPGDPDGSYLVHKLEGDSDIVGQRMPRTGGPFLTSGQMQILRRWIANGAPND